MPQKTESLKNFNDLRERYNEEFSSLIEELHKYDFYVITPNFSEHLISWYDAGCTNDLIFNACAITYKKNNKLIETYLYKVMENWISNNIFTLCDLNNRIEQEKQIEVRKNANSSNTFARTKLRFLSDEELCDQYLPFPPIGCSVDDVAHEMAYRFIVSVKNKEN